MERVPCECVVVFQALRDPSLRLGAELAAHRLVEHFDMHIWVKRLCNRGRSQESQRKREKKREGSREAPIAAALHGLPSWRRRIARTTRNDRETFMKLESA